MAYISRSLISWSSVVSSLQMKPGKSTVILLTSADIRASPSGLRCRHPRTSVRLYSDGARNRASLYDILEISPKASQAMVKASFYRLSKMYHPDVNQTADGKKRFLDVLSAYEVLGSRRSRKLYDQGIHATLSTSVPAEDVSDYRNFKKKEFKSRTGPVYGQTDVYNFDEFYRQHYGDVIRKRKEAKEAHETYEKEEEKTRQSSMRQRFVYFGMLSSLVLGLILKKKF